jgi:hypothetical protein
MNGWANAVRLIVEVDEPEEVEVETRRAPVASVAKGSKARAGSPRGPNGSNGSKGPRAAQAAAALPALILPPAPPPAPAPTPQPPRANGTANGNGATKRRIRKKEPSGVERDHDVPWGPRKIAVFKALKALGAVGRQNARPAREVADAAGVRDRDVRHYVYAAKSVGLADVVQIQTGRPYLFCLTAAGARLDVDEAFRQQVEHKGQE